MKKLWAALFLLGCGTAITPRAFGLANAPPPMPQGFQVEMEADGSDSLAVWKAVGNSDKVILTIDNLYVINGWLYDGALDINMFFDPGETHRYTLVAVNSSGESSPAVFVYTPPPPTSSQVSVPYEFVNTSSAPVSLTSITFNAPFGQRYVYTGVGAHQTVKGKFDLPRESGYYTGAEAFRTVKEGATNCGPLLNLGLVNGKWPANSTLVVTLKNAQNAKTFSCTFAVVK